jgi:hypothetical protein
VLHRGKVFGSDDDGLRSEDKLQIRGTVRKLNLHYRLPSYRHFGCLQQYQSFATSLIGLEQDIRSDRVSYRTEMLWRAEG